MQKEFDLVEILCPRCERWIPMEVDFPGVFLVTDMLTDVPCPHCDRVVQVMANTGRRAHPR